MKADQQNISLNKSFPFYLRRSTYIHVGLFLFSLAGGKMAYESSRLLQEKNLELIEASVRVDMVAMPKHTLNELKNISKGVEEIKKEVVTPEPSNEKNEVPKEDVKAEAKPEIKEAVQKDKSPTFEEEGKLKRQNFLSKLKSLSSKKVVESTVEKMDKGLQGEKSTNLKQLVLAGNKLNKGVQIYGEGNNSNLGAFQAYAAKLPDYVRPHWKLPSFLLDKQLKCRVRVWIGMNGDITRAEIYQSSGEAEYDQRAIDAVKEASPFPKLNEDFGKRGLNGDILLGFPL